MKLYSFLLWLCCFILPTTHTLIAQTTVDFNGLNAGEGYGKLFGLVEPGDIDELSDAGGFVFAITASHSLTSVVSVAAEGYNNSTCISTNSYGNGVVSQWIIKKNDNTKFQFKGVFLKDAGFGGSTEGTVTAYRGGQKVGAAVNVSFDGSLNQSFTVNPDFYDVDELRIEALDLDIYLDQFMAGPPYGPDVNAPAQVMSIVIEGNPNSSATTVNFLVMFDKPVMNVSVEDFIITSTGISPIAAIASVTGLSPSLYKVSVTGVTGEGTIKLGVHADTDIVTVVGSIPGTPAFTAGEIHSVGACGIENFDQGETDNASSFSNNGIIYQLTGNWKVRKYIPVRGLNGSGFHLSGTGTSAMSIKGNGNTFKVRSFYLFLSDDISGDEHATNGTVTVTGKLAGNQKFTQLISTDFNSNPASNSGYTYIDLEENGSIAVDELEIQLGGSFQYVDLDNISLCAILNNPPVNSVVPTISGTDKVGNVLSATTGSWTDADGHTLSYTYQWYRADNAGGMNRVPISSATNATYTLTTNDAHKHIQVVVTANDGNGATTQANSLYTAIQNSAPVNSVVPTISGTALVGNLLITTNGTWSDIDGDGRTYTYQWYRADDVSGTNEVVIAGANSTSYTTTTSDAHKYVKARVTANDGNGGITQANSLYTAIQNSAPVNSVVPTISGTALSGNTLSTTNGTWSDPDGDSPTYTYQWYRADDAIGSNETVILGANTASYMLVPNDVNKYFRVGVTANDGYGGAKVANSTYVLVLNTAPVLSNLDGDAVTYMEGGTAVLIDAGSNATVTDSDSPDFSGGNMKVAITANRVSDEDVLAIRNEGTGAGQIGVSGNNVTYGGVIIGTWIGGTGANDLVISFNGSAGPASAQALIRNLTYSNSNTTDPATAARTIAVTLNDGDGGTSIPAIVTVQITAVNDAPTLVTTAVNPTFTEDGAAVSLFSGTAISTIEAGQAISKLVFTVANVSDGNQEILTIDGSDVPLVSGTQTTGTNGLTVNVSVSGVSTTVGIGKSGGLSPAIMAGIVDGLTYRNTSTNPNITNRVITLSSIQDNGGTANGGTEVTSLSIASTITIVAVNDAPVVTVPLSIAVTEDIPSALTGISFSDVDAGTNSVTVTFSVPSGILSSTSGAGVTVGGTVSVLTLNGSISDINTFVAAGAITFTTASNATSNVTLTVSINDNGHTGGTVLSDTKTIALVVTAVNDAPVNSVPGPQSVDQDAILVFSAANNNQISVSDVDAGANDVRVTLAATNGLITLSGTSGLSVSIGSGTNDVIMIFNGTLADINDALNGLKFQPTPGYNGAASLQITTDDLGNTGSGGAKTATNDITITVKPINPKIVSVGASTADGTYKIDDVIGLIVTFDQQVIVNTTGGVPGLLLETGVVDREATYTGDNGSNTLTFSYTVQEGDTAPDLDYQSTTALSLNGATIKNSGGNDAVLTLPTVGGPKSIAGQHAIAIDGVRPTVASVAVPANGYYLLNQNLDFTVNFSEAVLVNKTGGTPGLSLTIGGQAVYANYLSGSGSTALEFRYVVINGLEDHDGITVSALSLNGGAIKDAAGNDANLTLNSVGSTTGVKVDAKPPAVPVNFTAIGQNGQVSLLWEANTEADLAKYILYVKGDDGSNLYVAEILKEAENFGYTGLPNGKTFEFVLVAVDQVGNRSAEALASAKTMSEQTISFATLGNLTYGQQALVLTASATSHLPVSFVSSDSDIAEVYQDNNDGGKWKVDAKKVGKVTITAAQAGNNEYLPAVSVNQLLTIVPASLTVTADAKTKVYGDADPALTYTVKASDLRNGDAVSVVSGTLTRAVGESVGSYDITNVDLAADNYTVNYEQSTLSITKANLTVTADAKTKVYGDADPALTYTVKASDLRNGDDASVVTGSITRVAGEDVGDYDITNVDLAADNYTVNYEQSTLSITKANLTVTADAKTKVYGDGDPALTYMVKASDLRNGDDASVVTGSITRVAGEDVGDYDINNVNLLASNYNIQYEKAKFLITKASIAGVTFADASFTYDGTVKSLVIAGALPVGTQVSYENNEQTEAGEYLVTAVIDGGNNYEGGSLTAKLTIMKAALPMFTFADASFVYDGTVKSLIITNLPAGVTATYSNNDHIDAGEYMVTAVIDGGKNYTGTVTKTAKLRISPLQQVLNFAPISAQYRDAGTVQLDITSNSDLPIQVFSDNLLVAEVQGASELLIKGVGRSIIRVEQAGGPNHIAAQAVEQLLEVVNDRGAKLPVRVHPAVSPNGDGINEFLRIEGIEHYPENKLVIFDGNGNVVQSFDKYDNHSNYFDGTKAGRPVPNGTYFYMLEVKVNGKWEHDKGYFVIRK